MKCEGLFLIAFIVLSIVLLAMVVSSEKEHFGKYSANNALAVTQLEEDVNLLNSRLSTAEKKLNENVKETDKAQEAVDNAATDIQIATAH